MKSFNYIRKIKKRWHCWQICLSSQFFMFSKKKNGFNADEYRELMFKAAINPLGVFRILLSINGGVFVRTDNGF